MTTLWQWISDWFVWPWLLLALPLPWLLPRRRTDDSATALVLPEATMRLLHPAAGHRGWRLATLLKVLAWLLLCVAAARPHTLGEPIVMPEAGRDVMLAVDISGSMEEYDMNLGVYRVDRLTAAKAVLEDFLERRAGDRIGLVVFGSQAHVIAPLTRDHATLRQQLQDVEIGIAGNGTAIGDAIGLSLKRLREEETRERVLVLLTDGENTAGTLSPQKATELAALEGLRIHTIALGAEPDTMSFLGVSIPLPMHAHGMDEDTLRQMAEATGGRFFRARDTDELAGIYAEIDQLEPVEREGDVVHPRSEHYWRVLLAALLVLLLALAVDALKGQKA